jgi:hypothetical protein
MDIDNPISPNTQAAQPFGLDSAKRISLIVIGFGVHVVVGTLLFIAIAAAAIVIEGVLGRLNPQDDYIRFGLKYAEYFVFGLDLLAFVVFMARSTQRFCIEMWVAI